MFSNTSSVAFLTTHNHHNFHSIKYICLLLSNNICDKNVRMKQTVNEICNTIIKNGYQIVLISGNGCAGKSTFANLLKEEYQKSKKTVCIIDTDDFLLDKNYRKNTLKSYVNKEGLIKKGYIASTFPEAYDFEKLKNTIAGKNQNLIIVEGIGAAFILDDFPQAYKIFLQTDKETEYQRRSQRARSDADLSKERIEMRYEQFELFVLPLADKFDLRLVSQDDFSYILQFKLSDF